ncbi:MAG: amidase [Alphaproteobacteria bacterium]|nr:amidase [Alphaproteobacteria bacterium]
MPSDPALATLVEAADAIVARQISAVELLAACLKRIEAWQPRLNAFIALEADKAMDAARKADAGPAKGTLHGVPLAHKDMYYRKGRIATCGSRIRRDWVADTTATALSRLDAAGAIDLGTLNLAEFAFGPTGHNYHFGHCRNPWNTDHITGGSSAGTGAATAARLIFGGLGSDTGGSIRMPAFCNGLAGIKPTWGRVSRHGAMTLSWTMDTVGPLARTVRDCARLFAAIAGPDANDITAASEAVPDYEGACALPAKGLRIGVASGYFDEDLHPQVARMIDAAVAVFERLGVSVTRVKMPDLEAVNAAGSLVTAAEAAAAHRPWIETRVDDYSPQVRARLLPGLTIPAVSYLDAQRVRAATLARFLSEVFDKCDAVLAPVCAVPVPTIAATDVGDSQAMPATLGKLTRLSRPFNAMGLPALSVPAGFDDRGLPLGLQLAGRPFDEATLFTLGAAFERETQVYRSAPG